MTGGTGGPPRGRAPGDAQPKVRSGDSDPNAERDAAACPPGNDTVDPVEAAALWASSGLAWLTGTPDGTPEFSRAPVLTRALEVGRRITTTTAVTIDVPNLLAGRAALLGLRRRGDMSAGGATALSAAREGWCALTLSRAVDVETVPALLESDAVESDPWPAIREWAARRPAEEITERARLLGLPAATLGETAPAAPRIRRAGQRGPAREVAGCLVVDLTSMWAGPLCGRLLAEAGATVVKVESPRRPDGTRGGAPAFFDWMNGEKLCWAADLDTDADSLRALLTVADIVLEGSRPAALERRGLGPHDIPARPGRVWLRITGHGTEGPAADHVAFGDDAAVSGGLVGGAPRRPVFCGDAIADPLTGLEAAAAVLDSLGRGGGELVELSMAAVAATYAALPRAPRDSTFPVLAPARDCATGGHLQVGRAIFAGRQWPREPKDCVCVRGDWYL
ncbi:CoA transferase, partial [Nocardia sp.]|uniref:CoA transferase n=1 Tax=Nocardia sp. TaxID=1821 RepID=UPI002582D834